MTKVFLIIIIGLIVAANSAFAAEKVYTHVFSGGGGLSSATTNRFHGAVGQSTPTAGGESSDGSRIMKYGYWYPIAYYDTTSPDTGITGNPASQTNLKTAGFTFTSTEEESTFQCSLDSASWEVCASPKNYSGLSDGGHTFEVRAVDKVGNSDPSPVSYSWTVDATAPSTYANVASGIYDADQNVTLTCDDGTGLGCSTIYYSTDGTNFSAYLTPLLISSTTTLSYYSIDVLNNTETPVNQRTYTLDKVPPTVTITSPANLGMTNEVYSIDGSTGDAAPSSGLGGVEISIFNGTHYRTAAGGWSISSEWLQASGTGTWTYDTSSIVWTNGKWYTVSARTVDIAGNPSSTAVTRFYFYNGTAVATNLTLTLSSTSIQNNSTVDLTGQLTRLPYDGQDLSGLQIRFRVTGPQGVFTPDPVAATSDQYGHYTLTGLSGFTQEGTYTIQAFFDGNTFLSASQSSQKSLNVGQKAGYAIIVVGSHPADAAGIPSHHKTGRRVYESFLERGFSADDIYFFSYQADPGVVDDSTPTKAEIQDRIKTWARDKMNNSAAPLYIVMVDHGNPNTFYIGIETIEPAELNTWLVSMEAGLTGNAPLKKRVVILGSCYSGSFVQTLAGTGRVIISSAAPNEESYRGPNEPDDIRSGEFFIEELFKELVKGYSFRDSFVTSTSRTEAYTLKGGALGNAPTSFGDYSVQHPLLEDTSTAPFGSNSLTEGTGDGVIADTLTLGIGVTNSATNPADFDTITGTLILEPADTTATFFGTVSDNNEVDSAWIEIRSMANQLTGQGGYGQLSLNAVKVMMTYSAAAGRWESLITPDLFMAEGVYEIYYFTQRKVTLEVSAMKRSRVYKKKSDNQSPGAFDLVAPDEGSEQKTVFALDWQDSVDPEGDSVTYTVLISEWSDFRNIAYKKEEVPASFAVIGLEAGLKDMTTYYWKVKAVDRYGAVQESTTSRSFTTNNTNGLPAYFAGIILNTVTLAPVEGVTISYPGGTVSSFSDGSFLFSVLPGSISVTASRTGFNSRTWSGYAATGDYMELTAQLMMTPVQTDTTPPETTIDTGPTASSGGILNNKSATFTFSASETATYECEIDSGGYSACSSPKQYNNLGEGSRTFKVRAKDSANNTDQTPAQWTWTVDTVAPVTNASPTGGVYTSGKSVTLSCADGGGTGCSSTMWCLTSTGANCSGAFTAYSSAVQISTTKDLLVYSTDLAGNNETAQRLVYTINIPPVRRTLTVNTTGGTGSGTVTISAPSYSDVYCSGSCSPDYDNGTLVTMSTSPAASSNFTSWSGNSDCSDGSVTMNADKSCTASFTLKTFTLTVNKAGTGTGTVTSNPAGVSCGADCSQAYDYGTVVALTATPAAGSFFTGWTGDSDCSNGSVTMTGARNCTANFVSGVSLTISKPGIGLVTSNDGGINCGTDCSQSYAPSTGVTLTAGTPDGCSSFGSWGGACLGQGNPCSLTMDAGKTATASFTSTANAFKVGGTTYATFSEAYDAANPTMLLARAVDLPPGNIMVEKTLAIVGGYTDCAFTTNTNTQTGIQGTLTVGGGGMLTTDGVVIK